MVDGVQVQGTFRAHQVPLSGLTENPEHLRMLEEWLRSYSPETLFDESGRLVPELRALAPDGDKRMSATPYANGGLREALPPVDLAPYEVAFEGRGRSLVGNTVSSGELMRDLYAATDTFRLFSPDETASNRLQAVFEVTDRAFMGPVLETDDHLSADGRVMEVLSEHLCQGWLEGYTLTGRHGVFATYEAFAMVSASMAVQHVKWLQHAQDAAVAGVGAVAERAAHLDVLAQRPQRLLAPGPGADRRRCCRSRRGSSACGCRRTPTRRCRSWTTACAARTTST